jgi:hypothetical protein
MSSYTYSNIANYGGRLSDNNTFVKQFVESISNIVVWIYKRLPSGEILITTADKNKNVLIPKDLIVEGSIITPSDANLKKNIDNFSVEDSNHLFNLEPKKYNYKKDVSNQSHFGFIAQDVEKIYPELVSEKAGYKTINYIELIPILVSKMKTMQEEINELKEKIII